MGSLSTDFKLFSILVKYLVRYSGCQSHDMIIQYWDVTQFTSDLLANPALMPMEGLYLTFSCQTCPFLLKAG